MGHWRAIHRRTRRGSKQRKGPIGWRRRGRPPQFPTTEERGRTATYHARPIPLSYRPEMARRAIPYVGRRLTPTTRNPDLVRNPLAELWLALRLSGSRLLPRRVYRVLGRLLGKGQTARLSG